MRWWFLAGILLVSFAMAPHQRMVAADDPPDGPKRIFKDDFIENLDGSKLYFLKSDVEVKGNVRRDSARRISRSARRSSFLAASDIVLLLTWRSGRDRSARLPGERYPDRCSARCSAAA